MYVWPPVSPRCVLMFAPSAQDDPSVVRTRSFTSDVIISDSDDSEPERKKKKTKVDATDPTESANQVALREIVSTMSEKARVVEKMERKKLKVEVSKAKQSKKESKTNMIARFSPLTIRRQKKPGTPF